MSAVTNTYMWTHEEILKFIQARIDFKDTPHEFLYQQILVTLGLHETITVDSAERLWNSLVVEYKIVSQPSLEPDDAAPPSWPFYAAMHNALLEIPTTVLPVTNDPVHSQNVPENVQIIHTQETLAMPPADETVDEEAARLELAFRNGEIGPVQEVCEEDANEQEIISELMISEEGSAESDEEADVLSNTYDQENEMEELWTEERVTKFVELRSTKESDIANFGYQAVYTEIMKEMDLVEWLAPSDARKKWSSLVKTYQQIKKSKISEKEKQEKWLFYDLMDAAMATLGDSSETIIKSKKNSDFIWSPELTRKFIRLRTAKHCEISQKGHIAVYVDILDKLGVSPNVTITMARKKWNSLLRKYQDEIAAGDQSWIFLRDMKQVMKHFKGANIIKLKSRASPEFLWPNDLTKQFIQLRIDKHALFTNYASTQAAYISIMEELDLGHILNPNQLRKKWNYLVAKYKELSSSSGVEGKSPTPHTWPFYEDMALAMSQIPKDLLHNTKIVRTNLDNIWTKDVIVKFIQLRGLRLADGTKRVASTFSEILTEMGLIDQVTPQQARKKWNYLYAKFVDLSHPDVDEFNKKSWPYFTAMQQAVGTLPFSQILSKRNGSQDLDNMDAELQSRLFKRPRVHVCFLCNKNGKAVNDYFVFEQNQKLLHTQKTATEIIGLLVGQKINNVEATTSLCTRCTNLVNEADNVFYRNDKLKEEAQQLYKAGALQARIEEQEILEQIRISTNIKDTVENQEKERTNDQSVEDGVVYSKRGRKRKMNVLTDLSAIKTEPQDHFDADDFDAGCDEPVRSRKKRGRARKRGRPRNRSTLVGRGLSRSLVSPGKKSVKGLKIYHCTECDAEFKKYTDLNAHKKSSHTVIDTTALEVKETVLEDGVITYFNKGKINSASTSHPCKECDKRFLRKDDLWYHQEVAHTEGKGRTKTVFKKRSYSCEECDQVFLFKYKLRMHINNKHLNDAGESANDFTCGQCGCKLGSLPGLTFHMRKHHKKSLTYRKGTEYLCSDCGFLATSSKKLKEHQDAHCGSSLKPKVQCEVCGKTVLKVSLKMHKVKMHNEFKEQCEKCGERYATKTELLRHFNVVHLGIWVYTCEACDQKFPTSDALRYHKVKTHQKATFGCTVCGKYYKRVGELNAHIKRTHDGLRKVETCQYCSKEYYDRSGLRTHLINKHNVPAEMTYSENYLRKKRVEGLPIAKHLEKRASAMSEQSVITSEAPVISHTHMQQPPQMLHHSIHNNMINQHIESADGVHSYQDLQHNEEEVNTALVVTEITENSTEQAVLVDPTNMIHHPDVTQIQAPMSMHPHMHHPMQHPPNMRLNVLYQMNMHPGPSHM